MAKTFTLFISNKHMKFYHKPYVRESSNSITFYAHVDNFTSTKGFKDTSTYGKIKKLIPNIKIMNIIFVADTMPPIRGRNYSITSDNYYDMTLAEIWDVIRSLKPGVKCMLLIGSCYGLYMHEHIMDFPKGSVMVTLSDYGDTTCYYSMLYSFSLKGNMTYILDEYIKLHKGFFYTPSIYFSTYKKKRFTIRSFFSFIKSNYYPTIMEVLRTLSLENMPYIFITESIFKSDMRNKIAYAKTLVPIRLDPYEESTFRNHPLKITKEINLIFETFSRKNPEVCKKLLVRYFDKLFKRHPYKPREPDHISYVYSIFKLRVNDELSNLLEDMQLRYTFKKSTK